MCQWDGVLTGAGERGGEQWWGKKTEAPKQAEPVLIHALSSERAPHHVAQISCTKLYSYWGNGFTKLPEPDIIKCSNHKT